MNEKQLKYRRRKSKVKNTVRDKIFRRDNHRCLECGSREDLTIDHVIPKSKGGTNKSDNLITLCKSCNTKKGNKTHQKYVLMSINQRT